MIEHEIIPLFGPLWLKANGITVLCIALILWAGMRIPPAYRDLLTKTIGVVLIGRFLFMQPYQMYLGKWTLQSSLPLHMCGMSAILGGVIMFYRNQWVYEFLYYWGLPGAFHSLLTPEFTLGTQGLFLPEYFLAHGGIILAALYATLVLGMKPRKGSWLTIFLYSQIFVVVIGTFNYLIDANYMYLCTKPIVENPFLFGEWPWYIVALEFIGLLHFLLVYLPFGLKYRREGLARQTI